LTKEAGISQWKISSIRAKTR